MKGQPWSAHLKTVDPASGADPKPVTFILPFYENPGFLRQQLAWWATFPAWLRASLSAIVVDDGSPQPAVLPAALPFPVRLFRIEVDVRWNWLAARNIGFHHAPEGWCLVTDIDHVIPESTATALVYGRQDPETIYGLSRVEHDGTLLAPHPNSWYLTRAMFWRVGGYDERMSGYYGSDGHWRRRLAATAPMAILGNRLIRHEHVGDSSTRRYQRKQPEDAKLRAIIERFPKGSTPLTLSFPYHEVVSRLEPEALADAV